MLLYIEPSRINVTIYSNQPFQQPEDCWPVVDGYASSTEGVRGTEGGSLHTHTHTYQILLHTQTPPPSEWLLRVSCHGYLLHDLWVAGNLLHHLLVHRVLWLQEGSRSDCAVNDGILTSAHLIG